jgi:hypothetical protein
VSIIDRREILFDADALTAVLACSGQMAGSIGLPSVAPKTIHFDPEEGRVTLIYGLAGHAVPVESGPLGALLIAYCLRAKIKVPRQFARSMRIEPQAVVMVFSATYLVPSEHLTAERPEQPPRSMSWMEPRLINQRRQR